jgi:hypothetical protein
LASQLQDEISKIRKIGEMVYMVVVVVFGLFGPELIAYFFIND